MRITKGMWRHKNFRDIDMLVVHVPYTSSQGLVAVVKWWRRDFGFGGFFLGNMFKDTQAVFITKEQYPNWEKI